MAIRKKYSKERGKGYKISSNAIKLFSEIKHCPNVDYARNVLFKRGASRKYWPRKVTFEDIINNNSLEEIYMQYE